jgi:hypothetical protein
MDEREDMEEGVDVNLVEIFRNYVVAFQRIRLTYLVSAYRQAISGSHFRSKECSSATVDDTGPEYLIKLHYCNNTKERVIKH